MLPLLQFFLILINIIVIVQEKGTNLVLKLLEKVMAGYRVEAWRVEKVHMALN